MLARQVVLLAPPKPSHPTQLLSRQQYAPVSPLASTLMDFPASVANKRLTPNLTPLDATATKNRGAHSSGQKLFSLLALPRRRSDDFPPRVFNRLHTLPSYVSRKSFACHSYENCRVYTNNSHSGTQPLRSTLNVASPLRPSDVGTFRRSISFAFMFLRTLFRNSNSLCAFFSIAFALFPSRRGVVGVFQRSNVRRSNGPITCIQSHRRLHPSSCIQSLCYPPLSAFGESSHSFYVGGPHE
jgi:hypothetical protein